MNDWFLHWTPEPSDVGFFDSLITPEAVQPSLLGDTLNLSTLETYAKPLAMGSIGLQGIASGLSKSNQAENIFTNVHRTERNIEFMQQELRDMLSLQVRKVSRRAGTQMAQIGASGVSVGSGSPLRVMAESHARGMEDYDAIHRKGKHAIDSAYLSIKDQLDRAEDIGTSMFFDAASTAARGAFTGAVL